MFLDKVQFQQEISHTKKGQALVITLLVLAIISIVVIGLVVVSNRDVDQVINNESYERLLNASEQRAREIIQTNGITTLPASCGTPSVLPNTTEYNCGSTTGGTQNDFSGTIETKIVDRRGVNDFAIAKDRSLDIALTGYTGELQFRWNKNVAMEFNIIYTDTTGATQSIKDVYDLSGVYDSLVSDDPNNDTQNIHDFNFQVLDTTSLPRSTKFTISSISGISLGNTVSLRVTPRSKTTGDIVNITVNAGSPSSFPFQIREFVITSIDSNNASSPLATVIAKVPLSSQIDDIFDYALLVKTNFIQ